MQKDLPGYNIELVKKRIRELQEKYEKEIKPNEKDYNEQNTKKDFIEPILRVLNWDTETKNQVDAEFCIKNKRSSGSADYALKINGEVKLLLEAKSFDKDLETGYDIINGQKRTYVEQLVGYAFDLNRHMRTKIDYCILTNGKEWRVYNVQWQGVAFDKKLVYLIKIDEFLTKFRKFWSIERGNVAKGDIDRFVLDEDKLPIDRKAVSSLLYCKKLLIDSVVRDYEKNKRDMKYMIDKLINKPVKGAPNGFPKFNEMPKDERLNKFVLEASSNVINKILFIRIIEDKGYLKPKLTKRSVEEWKSWFSQADRILRLFREACHEADVQYNGGIFDVNPYDTLNYDNDILDKIIGILGDFNFEEIDADVIGRIYEIYLGTVLLVEEEIRGKKRTKLSADYTERKKFGQYYTPKFVVDFIVKNTLGKLLEGKTPEEIAKIKVLDPACGSGSFLIRAFDYLKDYYVRFNDLQMSKIKKNSVSNMNNYIDNGIIIDYNHKILKENLHGVDLNALSTQICSINLWLRALEKDKKLEKLSKNILNGNSLIGGVENKEELSKYEDELKEIAKLRNMIKGYYGKELNKKGQDKLEEMESKLREVRNKVNTPLNENLKKYFENLDLVYPFNWEVEFTEVFDPDKSEGEQGFDVVIGNPPYVNVEKLNDRERDFFMQELSTSMKRFDIYVGFIEKGINLLKEGGLLSYIIPYPFLTQNYAEKLRKYVLTKCKIRKIVDLSKFKVFEDAVVRNIILILEKSEKNNQENEIEVLGVKGINETGLEYNIWKIKQKSFSEFPETMFRLIPSEAYNLTMKIEKKSIPLKSIAIVSWGARGVPASKFHLDSKINDKCRQMVKGKDVSRYSIIYSGKWFLYDESKLYRPSLKEFFENEKILISEVTGESGLVAAYDENRYYADHSLNCCILMHNLEKMDKSTLRKRKIYINQEGIDLSKKYNLSFILTLLNSRLLNFYFKKILGYKLNVYPESVEMFPLFKINFNDRNQLKQINKMTKMSTLITNLKSNYCKMLDCFSRCANNQPIPHEKDCKFAHYWDHGSLYDFSKDTLPFANKTKAKILNMNIKEDNNKLIIYTTNVSLVQDKKYNDIKTVELTIKNEILKKFLYLSIKKYIDEKKGRGFGSGIILEVIKKIPIPVYVANVKQNLDKIKKVMDEFEHETKDLWKIDGKTYKSITEIEEDIEKTDREIDEMVYDLYGITEKEKKVIEESLK